MENRHHYGNVANKPKSMFGHQIVIRGRQAPEVNRIKKADILLRELIEDSMECKDFETRRYHFGVYPYYQRRLWGIWG